MVEVNWRECLKIYVSVRLDIRRIVVVKQGDEIIGNETRVKVIRNKLSLTFKPAELQVMYGKGVYQMGE